MGRETVFDHISGILLAGTHPWTNSSFDSLLPRTLLPVGHRPLIGYGLSWLERSGVRSIAVCGNRETRVLRSRLERHVPPGVRVSYCQDPMPRGAAGSACDAAMLTDAQTFVVAEGTAIPNVDLDDLLRQHRRTGACVTVVVHPERRGSGHPVLHVPNGIYVFEREAFDEVPASGFCDIKEELIPRLYAANRVVAPYEVESDTPRVLDASTYMAVNEWMLDELVRRGTQLHGYLKTSHGLVHRDAVVANDAAILGPVLVGPGARIQAGAVVVGPTSIGREAVIKSNAMVSCCSVWRRSVIGEGANVERCIIGDDAIVEPGAHVLRGVLSADGWASSDEDWVERQARRTADVPSLDVGARLGRLVFGAGWTRSQTAQ